MVRETTKDTKVRWEASIDEGSNLISVTTGGGWGLVGLVPRDACVQACFVNFISLMIRFLALQNASFLSVTAGDM